MTIDIYYAVQELIEVQNVFLTTFDEDGLSHVRLQS